MSGGSRQREPGQGGAPWVEARDFATIPGLAQVVGHTVRREPNERLLQPTVGICSWIVGLISTP